MTAYDRLMSMEIGYDEFVALRKVERSVVKGWCRPTFNNLDYLMTWEYVAHLTLNEHIVHRKLLGK